MLDKNRVDLYSLIHKAQRVRLFALSSKIALADLENSAERAEIIQELQAIITHLKAHAQHEANFIHPLFASVGNLADLLGDEHEELEEGLELLEEVLEQENWEVLYTELNRFIALYLIHQDQEEAAQSDVLWKNFDDEKLAQVLTAFKAGRTAAQAQEDLEFVLPCLNISELAQLFKSIKAGTPAPVFEDICKLAQGLVDPERFMRLRNFA